MIQKMFLLMFLSLNMMAGSIMIAVAANVSYVIDDLKKEFNKVYPDIKVNVTLGSSCKLTAQIKHGAPYQLFMSANMDYPNALYKEKIAITKPRVYAMGTLACFSSKGGDFTRGIYLVESPNIKKIAIANPRTAPYGIATAQALKNAGLYKKIEKKFVYGESISQTLSYSISAADMGFIAKSALFSPKMAQYKEGKHWIDVDSKLYTPINQGIVVLKNANHTADVDAFYTFMLSEKAKKVLQSFGYLVP